MDMQWAFTGLTQAHRALATLHTAPQQYPSPEGLHIHTMAHIRPLLHHL